MTTLEVIPNDAVANELLNKIEMTRCLALLGPNNIMPAQLRLNAIDTYYSVARKLVKAYIRQLFPSSENPQVLTRYIKMDMIPTHSRVCLDLYGYQNSNREEVTLLRFIEPIRVALENFHQSLQMNRNYLYVQCNSANATFFVRASSDDFINRRGSVKEYVSSVLTALRTTKEALDAVILAIGDFDETIARCRVIKAEQDEQERLRQANAVADICTKLTGIGYGPFATAANTTPRRAPRVARRTEETTNVAPQAETATTITGRVVREALDDMIRTRGPQEPMPRAHLDGLTVGTVILDEMAHMPDTMEIPITRIPVTHIPITPEAPRMTDMNGNVVRPAEPELQARLNQILREQGVVI